MKTRIRHIAVSSADAARTCRACGTSLSVFAALLLAGCLASCGGANPPANPPVAPVVEDDPAPPADALEGGGDIVWRVFDDSGAGAGPEKPTMIIKSPKASQTGDNDWVFENAEVTLYNREGRTTTLDAARGELQYIEGQVREEALGHMLLTDGVRLRTDTMEIELADLRWQPETRTMFSDNPVSLRDGETELHAAGLRFAPDTGELTLKEVRGTLEFKRRID